MLFPVFLLLHFFSKLKMQVSELHLYVASNTTFANINESDLDPEKDTLVFLFESVTEPRIRDKGDKNSKQS